MVLKCSRTMWLLHTSSILRPLCWTSNPVWLIKPSQQGLDGLKLPHPPPSLPTRPEPVNDFETLTIAIYWAGSPVVDVTGGLIQTASGWGSGFGIPRTKRSG